MSTNPPSIPYNPSRGFTFHDVWTAVDVELNGKGFLAKQNCSCTLYTNECFPGSQNVQTTLTLLDLQNSIIGFGLLGERSTDACRSNCVGHSNILDSIGCAVGRGEVLLVFKGKTMFRAAVNTHQRISVQLELVNGHVTFGINGSRLDCPELQKLNLSKGRFRLGVSPTRVNQAGIFATQQELAAMTGGGGGGGAGASGGWAGSPPGPSTDGNAPRKPYNPRDGFLLHDRWKSMDVVNNGRAVKCVDTVRGTSYTEQIFSGGQRFRATLRVIEQGPTPIAFGLLGYNSTLQCADYVLGETEIPDSVGCVLKENQLAIVFRDNMLFSAEVAMFPNPEISIIVQNGRVRFELDGRAINCEALRELNFGDGHFRLGVSMTTRGQVAEVMHIGNDSTEDPDAPLTVLSPHGFSFHDRWRSIDIKNGVLAICGVTCKGTAYTKEVFRGDSDLRVSLRVAPAGGLVAFGVLGFQSTKACADNVLGERAINDSIGCVIRGNGLGIMFNDDVIFQAEIQMPPEVTITVIMAGGHLRFELDGRNLDCPRLNGLNLAQGIFRLGVSLTKQGQAAELQGQAGPAAGPDTEALTEDYDGGIPSFHDRWRSMDVKNQSALICNESVSATTYTIQKFRGNFNVKHTFKFAKRMDGVVVFGIIGHTSTRATAENIVGSPGLADSIGCLVKQNTVAVVVDGNVLSEQEFPKLGPDPAITLVLQNGKIRFEVNDDFLACDELRNFDLSEGTFRLAVSLTTAGQSGYFVGGPGLEDVLPASAKIDVIEGEKDLMYKWHFDNADANREGTTVTSKSKGAKAFSQQFVSNEKFDGVVCDACFRGDANRRKFDCTRWKCTQCNDYDLCNDCYWLAAVKHDHARNKFIPTVGGCFHEMRFKVRELFGSTFDVGLVRRGDEAKFGENTQLCVTGGPSGWSRGKLTLNSTAVKNDDEIAVRLQNFKLVVVCNNLVISETTVERGLYRFATRFSCDKQALTMLPRTPLPRRGTPVVVSSDPTILKQEAKLCGLDVEFLKPGAVGWVIDEDTDATIKLCIDDAATATMWVPRAAVTVVETRLATAKPSMEKLPKGTKVVRNLACWIHGQQDGGPRGNRVGEVLGLDDEGRVRVKWANGTEGAYAYGKGIYNIMPWVGNTGDRVVRNPAGFEGGLRGNYGAGTVQSIAANGVLTVQWESGETGTYKFNEEAQEVQLAGTGTIAPLAADAPSSPLAASGSAGSATGSPAKNQPAAAAQEPSGPPPPPTALPAPPAPPMPAPPPPANAVERSRGAETENLMDVGLKPAMRLKQTYRPTVSLAQSMIDGKGAFTKITEMDFIIEQCKAIASDRRKANNMVLDDDEAMSLALYTFDLGTMSDCPAGSDNFYFQLNEIFRSRNQAALLALQPFMYFFKMAWTKLPNITGTFYRGIPKSALKLVKEMYGPSREVYWSSITSLSIDRHVAENFANKEGPGGILMEITVVDSRSISKYSAIPREGEVILEPNTKLVVIQPVTPDSTHHTLKLLQVKQEKAFVF